MSRKGFTLIEMLIVVAIIGILASTALVGLGPLQKQARDSRRASDLRQVQPLLELYFAKNGKYPDGSGGASSWVTLETNLQEVIPNAQLPRDPREPVKHYEYYGSPDTYILRGELEDLQSSLLSNDIDGSVSYGGGSPVDCEDTPVAMYCIRL